MDVGLLGALAVTDDQQHEVVVTGDKQRRLLALLALHAGRVVPTDQLVDALWGDAPPAGVRNALQGLVSKLRRTLGSAELIAMRGDGYALELPPESVDVHRYEQLVAAGQAAATAGDLTRAATVLADADAMWRGDPLADFTYDDFAAGAIARLSELRLTAIEARLDIELQLGRHHAAVVQIEEVVAAEPLRERARGLLMTALYRAGRQADALRVVQDGRRILRDELGLEPGPELRRLEAAILAHDPSLDPPAAPAPAPVERPRSRPTIPAALSPLVGRHTELHDLTALLAEHRFVTLVGPGGVGKTRLALEAARSTAAALEHGGCLVELAPVGDPVGVRAAIATALDLPDAGGLAAAIGERELLVVLDNCEHVITTAAEVAEDLLRRCPNLRLLATSREGLRVGGEMIWPVPPLAADDAVRLFIDRAEAAGAPLERSDEHLAVVADICRRLDGLPLAIELAAARTRAFPLTQLASRLNDRFRLLTGGSRTALPRQQTLRAVVDWSYALLFDHEQRVFERLSVFPGGCDLATAEQVCADDELAPDDVQDVIAALVDKSLVIATPHGDGLRYGLLQTLAQYAREKLTERGDAESMRDAMAAHYAALCARSAAAYVGAAQRAWLTAIDQEQDNVRAALEWAVANDDAETALAIAGGASWTHWLAGTLVEGRRWLDEAFECRGEARATTRALGLTGRGLIEFLTGDQGRADADFEAALATFADHGDLAGIALARSFYAEVALVREDFDEARRRRLDQLHFYEDLPDEPYVHAVRAYARAKLAGLDGDLDRAEAEYRSAAAGFAQLDRPVMLSITLGTVADFDERARDYAAATRTLEEAIATNETVGLRGYTDSLLGRLGWVLLHQGEPGRAELHYARALEGARRLRNEPVLFLALTGTAVIDRLRGDQAAAGAAALEALRLFVAGGPRRFRNRIDPISDTHDAAAACCSLLAVLAAEAGDAERAARLLGHAQRLRDEVRAPVPDFQRDDLDEAQHMAERTLGDAGFLAALARGKAGELAAELVAQPT